MISKCLFCNAPLYQLSDGRVKCVTCKKRYSPKRMAHMQKVIALFCNNLSAQEATQQLGVSYGALSRHYQQLRSFAANECEVRFESHRQSVSEYDEYLYLERTKRSNPESIFDAYNFVTFDYGGAVYNLLMPSLSQYKEQFLRDGIEQVYFRQFSKYMRQNKIIKITSRYNTITEFWDYFETFITRYKGVSERYFPYYLKEAEFKFNLSQEEQRNVLFTHYLEAAR